MLVTYYWLLYREENRTRIRTMKYYIEIFFACSFFFKELNNTINAIINTDFGLSTLILRLFIKQSYVLMKVVLRKGSGSLIDTYYNEWNIST